jgi:hypothetical protein
MMFFVAKDDGSREHYFTATYAEHNAYKDSAVANRARLRMLAFEAEKARADSTARAVAAAADKTAPAAAMEHPAPLSDPVLREARPGAATERKIQSTP